MLCSRCQHENRPRAKFCEECGASLSRACRSCGAELPTMARFCPECGKPIVAPVVPPPGFASPQSYTPKHLAEKILTSKSALEGERKQVTVFFADLKGSMELLADRDPEEARSYSTRFSVGDEGTGISRCQFVGTGLELTCPSCRHSNG
jgi:hypothetical protein